MHLDTQAGVVSQQMNKKRKGVDGDEEIDVGTQDVDKEAGRVGDEEQERGPTTEDEETGASKEAENSKRRGRRRINVESDSE